MTDIRARSDRFFIAYAVLLLLVVFIGFSPTFFLRFLTADPPRLTGTLVVHGAILTGWFLLLVIQATLVGRAEVRTHERVGYAGACFGVLVIVGVLAAPVTRMHRLPMGVTLDMDLAYAIAIDNGMDLAEALVAATPLGLSVGQAMSLELWDTVLTLTVFSILLGAAISLRSRPEVHKRLILLSSLTLLGPALARISRWPPLGGEGSPFSTVAVAALIFILVFYDVASRGRVHAATMIGGVMVMAERFIPIGDAQFWQPILRFFT